MYELGQQFEYGFDDIGNRKTTGAGGDAVGANLRYASYTNNSMDQITSRSVPGFVNVVGTAKTNATVTLWGDNGAFSATSRKVDYFRGELTTTNTSALWLGITNVAVLNDGSNPDIVTNTVGKAFVPQTPEVFYYDQDGNLTNDGRWTYTWDAENRLVQQESLSSAPTASKYKLEFTYDSKSRRIQKLVSTNNGSTYGPQYTNRFAYDGWNLVAILNPQSSILQSFTWGLDLSGSLQGAGGVGGLLMVNDQSTINNQPSTHFSAYDGNGNVAALVAAASGAVSATYEYGPFSEVVRQTGPMAKANKFRFSTKYQDDESDYLYYGYRSYNPSSGRWLNRDPLEERGGNNLYGFVGNDAVSGVDFLGLKLTAYVLGSAKESYFESEGAWQGSTTGTWKANIRVGSLGAGGLWPVIVTGDLEVTMTVGLNGTDEQGRTSLEHEGVHESIHARWWNQTKSDVDGIEGKYCRKKCADIAAAVGNTIKWMNFWQSREDNVLFDLKATGQALRLHGLYELKQQEARNAKVKFDEQERIYKQLAKEWEREKCTKSE